MSSAPERMEPEPNDPLQGNGAVEKQPSSFAAKFKAVSVEKPPSKNPIAFIAGVCGICCVGLSATACLTACCCVGFLFQFIPIAEIIVGAMYYDKEYCPQENIALLLIIGGCIGVFHGLVECCGGGNEIKQQGKDSIAENGSVPSPPKQQPIICRLLFSAMRIATLIWLIIAAIVVYRFYGTVSYDQGDEAYCRPILYRFLFWIVTINIIVLACVSVVMCCTCFLGVCAATAAATAA